MKFIPDVASHSSAVTCRGVGWFYSEIAVRIAQQVKFSADYPSRGASIRLIRVVR